MDKRSHIHIQFGEEKEQRDHAGLEKSVTSLTGHSRDSATPPPSSTTAPCMQCSASLQAGLCPGWYSHFHSNQLFCHRDTILTPGGF